MKTSRTELLVKVEVEVILAGVLGLDTGMGVAAVDDVGPADVSGDDGTGVCSTCLAGFKRVGVKADRGDTLLDVNARVARFEAVRGAGFEA